MNAQVVCVSSREPKEPYYRLDCFLASLKRFAEVPTILGTTTRWDGLMTKPFLYRDWLRAGNNTSDRLIVCDAWDILFVKHPHWVGDRCQELFGDAIVFNGEVNLWPLGHLAESFPDTGPRRFLNSGFICGPAEKILALLEAMDLESIGVDRREGNQVIEPNDQAEFQKMFARQYEPATCFEQPGCKMVVDGNCEVSMTFSATEPADYALSGEGPDRAVTFTPTGTQPGVLHFNGDGLNKHMHNFLRHWELP